MREAPGRMNQYLMAGLMTLIFFSGQSQGLKDHQTKGDRFYQRKDYKNAISEYLEALKLDATDARTHLQVGIAYLQEGDFSKALTFLLRASNLNPDVDPNIDYHLATAYQETQQYALALTHYQIVKSKNKSLSAIASRKIRECALADSLMKVPSRATVAVLDETVNTSFAEVAPLISADGQTLIFTSNRSADDYEIKSGTNDDDVYISWKQGKEWEEPARIGGEVNVKLNETALSLSTDGRTLLLYYEEGAGDIYSSVFEDGKWSQPVALNRFINHPQYREASACISADGKKLYFSSNRAGGRGGYDIYVSEMGPNGQWGRPANLGTTINTRGDEITPYLHADGVTLYFSSNGRATLGGTDIYKSTLAGGKWTKPEHLGHPVNSTGPDEHFVLSPDGRTAYFNRRNGTSPGNMDIFFVAFNEADAPSGNVNNSVVSGHDSQAKLKGKVAVLKGSVVDSESEQPVEATLTVVDNTSKAVVATVSTTASGTFELGIPHGGNYGLTTASEGYLFNSMNLTIPEQENTKTMETRIVMMKGNVGSKVVLRNVFFDRNDAALKPESHAELENIRDMLLQHPDWRMQVNGHTDNTGDAKANMALSYARAEAVVRYLVAQGIEGNRLQARGYGSQQPLVSNDDEADGRQINRRTEIEIIR